MLMRPYSADICWICAQGGVMSREHKFKASDLRRHFGKAGMVVGRTGRDGKLRSAQGIRSKRLMFESPICHRCNSVVTQAADRAYDRFIARLENLHQQGNDLASLTEEESYGAGAEDKLAVRRYYAKILGCHLADFRAPIPLRLAEFVVGRTDDACIELRIRSDPDYKAYAASHSSLLVQHAEHGGLAVIGDSTSLAPTRFHSTSAIGPVQAIFWLRLQEQEVVELRNHHAVFYMRCAEQIKCAIHEPIPIKELEQLGLA